ncbi:hypothetical protein BX666DRAFT_436638 [Dichotomocladium elegans]|nr:hypothetical protein BX666DRAFT_436638 [Dichotomocladium elegans]
MDRRATDDDRPPWDLDIWNELPPDLKQEILADHRREKEMRERSLANERFREAHDRLAQSTRAHWLNIPLLEEPALMGKTDTESVRGLIRQWIGAFPESPEPEDEDLFTSYLCELVRAKNVERAQLLVRYLDHVASNERWRQCVLRMREKVNDQVISIFHCPLLLR